MPPIITNPEQGIVPVGDALGNVPWLEHGIAGQISSIATLTQMSAIITGMLIIERKRILVEREECHRLNNRIEEKLKLMEQRNIETKWKLYKELEAISRGCTILDRIPTISQKILILSKRLIELEKMDVELSTYKDQIRGKMLSRLVNRIALRKELKMLDEREYQVYLQKEHVISGLRDIDVMVLNWANRTKNTAIRYPMRKLIRVLNQILKLEVREGRLERKEERYE